MASIYKTGETDEIFGWKPSSNNNFLYSGKGSMILNAISATRTPEDQNLPFVDDLWIWPIPKGPHGRFGLEHVMGCYVVWKFAKNKPAAEKFLADLHHQLQAGDDREQALQLPELPRRVPVQTRSRPPRRRTRTSRAGSTRSSTRSRRSTRTTSATPASRTRRSTRSS